MYSDILELSKPLYSRVFLESLNISQRLCFKNDRVASQDEDEGHEEVVEGEDVNEELAVSVALLPIEVDIILWEGLFVRQNWYTMQWLEFSPRRRKVKRILRK